jgi:hypothetical protein
LEPARCLSLAEILTKEQRSARSTKPGQEEIGWFHTKEATHRESFGVLSIISPGDEKSRK